LRTICGTYDEAVVVGADSEDESEIVSVSSVSLGTDVESVEASPVVAVSSVPQSNSQ
jgi:hypothetical protein